MKLNEKILKRIVDVVFKDLKAAGQISFKDKEEKVAHRAVQILNQEVGREADLDQEVHKMMDELERQNPESFERYKMFPLLKKRLAKEKGYVLWFYLKIDKLILPIWL